MDLYCIWVYHGLFDNCIAFQLSNKRGMMNPDIINIYKYVYIYI